MVLKEEIANRRKNQQFFSEMEIWYLLYNLVKAGMIFEAKGIKLGDMHPNSVLLNELGHVKLLNVASMPN